MEEMKLPSKPSSSSSRPNSTQAMQSSGEPQPQPQPQFVPVLDTSKSVSYAPARRVIPPIPNGRRPRRWCRHARTEEARFSRLLEEMSRLPDGRGFEEFADMPVESFGAAVLAGYGWSEGMALGRKRKVGEVHWSDSEKIGDDMVAELGSAAEEDKFLKKLKKLEISDRDERKRKEERKRDERRGIDEEAKPVEKSSGGGGGVWGGKLYEQKGEVVDVVGLRNCDITMDGSGELVQGVDQEMLETAQPKYGGFVLVLYGEHKGVFGSPVDRDMEEETGVIRDADSHAPIDVRLDKIAEYVGDPSH